MVGDCDLPCSSVDGDTQYCVPVQRVELGQGSRGQRHGPIIVIVIVLNMFSRLINGLGIIITLIGCINSGIGKCVTIGRQLHGPVIVIVMVLNTLSGYIAGVDIMCINSGIDVCITISPRGLHQGIGPDPPSNPLRWVGVAGKSPSFCPS